MAKHGFKYDEGTQTHLTDVAAKFLNNNFGTHNGLFYKYLFLNIVALIIDVTALHILDFVLQSRFLYYGIAAYPYSRDPKRFSDYMSQMFPPFASCELDKENQLTAKRTEKLGCHLTFMELYEKIFLILWFWLIFLTFVTCVYIIFLILMMLPFVQQQILRPSKPTNSKMNARPLVTSVAKLCKVGDIYLLYRLKQHLSHSKFYDLMTKLSNREGKPALPQPSPGYPDKPTKPHHPETLRNRKGTPGHLINDTPINPEYLQQIMRNPNMMQQRPQHPSNQEAQQRTPLLNKNNTSILIE